MSLSLQHDRRSIWGLRKAGHSAIFLVTWAPAIPRGQGYGLSPGSLMPHCPQTGVNTPRSQAALRDSEGSRALEFEPRCWLGTVGRGSTGAGFRGSPSVWGFMEEMPLPPSRDICAFPSTSWQPGMLPSALLLTMVALRAWLCRLEGSWEGGRVAEPWCVLGGISRAVKEEYPPPV